MARRAAPAEEQKTNARPDSVVRLLTISAAAAELGVSRTRLYSILKSGALGYVRWGTDRRIPSTELAAWVERNTVKALV